MPATVIELRFPGAPDEALLAAARRTNATLTIRSVPRAADLPRPGRRRARPPPPAGGLT
jgi:hypothetical protein